MILKNLLLKALYFLLFLFLGVYIIIYFHKKALAHIQSRRGPLQTGFHGTLQMFSQILKSLLNWPKLFTSWQDLSNNIGVMISLTFAILAFLLIPLTEDIFLMNIEMSLPLCLSFIMISNMGAFLSIKKVKLNTNKMAALLDRISTVLIFSIPLFISSMGPVIVSSSFNLFEIVRAQSRFYNFLYQPLSFIVFLLSCSLLWQRLPVDVPKKDTYFNTDYLSTQNRLNYLISTISEYINIISLLILGTLLYLGGWNGPKILHPLVWTIIKTFILQVILLFLYTIIPRIRGFRKKMNLSLAILCLLSFLNLLIIIFLVLYLKPIF